MSDEKVFAAFYESLERFPVIAGINNDELLQQCKTSSCEIVYILYGSICNIADIVEEVLAAGKTPVVHMDLISGFSSKEICVDFIKQNTRAAGIISTKPQLIRRGNELGLITIQRFFMMDRISFHNLKKYVKETDPDIIEIMPAGLPKMIQYALEATGSKPVIASGLVLDKSDVLGALSAGAVAISTTNTEVWDID